MTYTLHESEDFPVCLRYGQDECPICGGDMLDRGTYAECEGCGYEGVY